MHCSHQNHAAQASRWWPWLFFAVIIAVAIFSGRGDVGGWNDASRLATVESLVDYGSLSIDASVFTALTWDKIRVEGHFFSDKPPVPALFQALLYAVLQGCFGLNAQDQPDLFCYAMSVGSSGLAYLMAVLGVHGIGRRLGLSLPQCLLLAGSFAFSTLALVYARQVNSHIMLLAITCWLLFGLIPTGAEAQGSIPPLRAALLGVLAGAGYTIDLGAGPVLLLGTFFYLAWQGGSLRSLGFFLLATFPLLALHHGLNYAIGSTFGPVAAVPEYFQWEGSAFNDGGLTGSWMHKHVGICLRYGISLLIAEQGFFSHQPVLWLALVAFGLLLIRRIPESPQLCLAGFWCLGIWGLYTAGSNNHAGLCCSIRWFLPLLAPAYFVLALSLRHYPRLAADLAVISVWGMFLAILAWCNGPWAFVKPSLLITAQTGALLTWTALRVCQWRLRSSLLAPALEMQP